MENVPDQHRNHGDLLLLKFIADEIEKGQYPPGSVFRCESMIYVFKKIRVAFGPMFSDHYLRGKIKELKERYNKFSLLLSQDGIYWNREKNIVYGNEKVLRKQYRAHYWGGDYRGEEFYDLMCQVFDTGIMYE